MLSTQQIILEYLCPAMGMVTANVMFSAPYRDVRRAAIEGRLGDLNPTPWAVMLGNTIGWVTYGILIKNLFVFFGNAPGFILSVWLNMQALKLQYGDFRSNETRKSILLALEDHQSRSLMMRIEEEEEEIVTRNGSNKNGEVQDATTTHHDDNDESKTSTRNNSNSSNEESTMTTVALDYAKIVWDVTAQNTKAPVAHEMIVLFMVALWSIMISIVTLGSTTLSSKTCEYIVGVTVNANLVFFYGAPLSTILTVVKTRCSSSIHVPTMIWNTANGVFWAAFGIAVFDMFIAVPNALGALLGAIQFVLCFLFPRQNTSVCSTIVSKEAAAPVSGEDDIERAEGNATPSSDDNDESSLKQQLESEPE